MPGQRALPARTSSGTGTRRAGETSKKVGGGRKAEGADERR